MRTLYNSYLERKIMCINNRRESYCEYDIKHLRQILEKADAILIGAGSGLSAAAGLTYSGSRFEENFKDFIEEYGLRDMYSAAFYPYGTPERYWGYWSRHVYHNRYEFKGNDVYRNLFSLVRDKDYFVLTTNVDHQFQLNGFDKKRLFYTQGDYGLFQCSKPCHQKTYDNKEIIYKMVESQKNLKIPSDYIPYCEKCGAPMTMNLRTDDTFVQDEGWYKAQENYKQFLLKHQNSRIVFLELGVGGNTPGIIKYPFWSMTKTFPSAIYVCINKGDITCINSIIDKAVLIDDDIKTVLENLKN